MSKYETRNKRHQMQINANCEHNHKTRIFSLIGKYWGQGDPANLPGCLESHGHGGRASKHDEQLLLEPGDGCGVAGLQAGGRSGRRGACGAWVGAVSRGVDDRHGRDGAPLAIGESGGTLVGRRVGGTGGGMLAGGLTLSCGGGSCQSCAGFRAGSRGGSSSRGGGRGVLSSRRCGLACSGRSSRLRLSSGRRGVGRGGSRRM